jgi:PhnB protein
MHFKDTARGAMEFYQSVFGGKLDTTTFKAGGVPSDAAEENLLMHAMLVADNGIVIMAADTPKHMDYKPGNTISMSLSGEDESVLRGYWEKLSQGARIDQPLEKAPWGDTFGMLTDKYGIEWMVDILPAKK